MTSVSVPEFPHSAAVNAVLSRFLYGNFASGIWKRDGSTWSQVTPNDPQGMVMDAGK